MTKTKKVRVTGEYYTDLRLWFTAKYLLGIGVRRRKGQFHPLLAASLFAYFAFEAYLNELRRQLDPEVWTRERTFFGKGKYQGTLGKFRCLAAKVGYLYSSSARPFQTVTALAKIRDFIAHGKVEMFDLNTSADRADLMPLVSRLDEWGKVALAKRAVTDVEELADGLMAATKATRGEWAGGYRSSGFVGIRSTSSITLEEGANPPNKRTEPTRR